VSELNTDRLVRSAIAGSAGEPSAALILEATGRLDGSCFESLDDIQSFWDSAMSSDLTVEGFIDANKI
jgi:hypothetical protein